MDYSENRIMVYVLWSIDYGLWIILLLTQNRSTTTEELQNRNIGL